MKKIMADQRRKKEEYRGMEGMRDEGMEGGVCV